VAKQQEPKAPDSGSERPSEVRITVTSDPDANALWSRLASVPVLGRWPVVAVLVALVAVTALEAGIPARNRHPGAAETSPAARARGALGIAGADGYPALCLSITISAANPSYARADFNRATPCGRYTGYAIAVFHRARGVWRTVLKATEYECPVTGLPIAVQVDLDICLRGDLTRSPAATPALGHEYDRNYVVTTASTVDSPATGRRSLGLLKRSALSPGTSSIARNTRVWFRPVAVTPGGA
jgi:hypothetical protein